MDLYCQQLLLTVLVSCWSNAPSILPWRLAHVPQRPAPGPSVGESNSHPAIIRFAGVAAVSASNFVSVFGRTLLFIYFTHRRWLYITYLHSVYQPLLVHFDLWVCHPFSLCSSPLSPGQKLDGTTERDGVWRTSWLASNYLPKNSLSLKWTISTHRQHFLNSPIGIYLTLHDKKGGVAIGRKRARGEGVFTMTETEKLRWRGGS